MTYAITMLELSDAQLGTLALFIVWLFAAALSWAFIAGASIANGRRDEHVPEPLTPGEERAAHRAVVEAGYASLDGYVEKYGDK